MGLLVYPVLVIARHVLMMLNAVYVIPDILLILQIVMYVLNVPLTA